MRATLRGVRLSLDAMERALDEELPRGLYAALQDVAADAREHHEFTNRTGDLENSIEALESSGSFLADTLSGYVNASEEYASYVDDGRGGAEGEGRGPYAFLLPAWARSERAVEHEVERALLAAVRRAGWR